MLFVHDHKFRISGDGSVYTAGSLTDNLFKRYEDIFGDTAVFANKRGVSDDAKKEMSLLRAGREMHLYSKYDVIGIKKLKKISELVKKEKYVVLRLPSINGNLVGLAMLLQRKKYMVEVVGCPRDALSNHGFVGKLLMPIVTFFTKFITKRAAYALYVTDVFLQERYPTNGKGIGCSDVVLDETGIADEPKEQKSKEEKLILGTAGSVDVRYKGQEYVIEAIAELKKAGIEVEYRLAGSGMGELLRKKAKELNVEDRVKFCGLLDRVEINKFYDSLDIYVQPSLAEGMPRAVIEAMSKGCYCIGTDAGGIPELVGLENCFEKRNVSDIVRKVLQYYEADMKKNCIDSLNRSRNFTAEVLKQKREKFYNDFKNCVDLAEEKKCR